MDPVSGLILVVLFAALPAGAIALVVRANNRRDAERRAAWGALAKRLGLKISGDSLFGGLAGQPVALSIEMRSSGKSQIPYTVASSSFHPGLDLGLVVRHQGAWDDFVLAFGAGKDHDVGDADFDRTCVVNADEQTRAERLLGASLRKLLVTIDRSRNEYLMTDAGFRIEARGAIADARWLEWALRATAEVSRLVNEMRGGIAVASPLAAHREPFRRYAAETGLNAMDTPLCIGGRMNGVNVLASAVRTGPRQYQLQISVQFDESLHRGLLVRPASRFDAIGHLFGGAHHDLGDKAFDRAFVVKGADRDEIAAIVDADVRRQLFDLNARVGSVELRDDGLSLRLPSLARPELVPVLVEQAKSVAECVYRNARLGARAAAGPYR